MISSVKGTQDIFFPEILRWQKLEAAAREVFRCYGFTEIRTPALEHTELFVRGIGGETDIVSKEMYTFQDKKGRSLTLRPENTAGVARSLVEHGICESPAHSRLYYIGPQFRYERPQKGRYRQFYQVGMEVIGEEAPECDAEGISLAIDLIGEVGITEFRLNLNSVGCPDCRPKYTEALKTSLSKHVQELCQDCQRRVAANPLRVLDCKIPACQPILDSAPRIAQCLCDACAEHYGRVKKALDLMEIPFSESYRLVRGLDYYVRTVFEITGTSLGAQDALLGGGRYDGLLRQLGGPDLCGFGWALGVERFLLAMPPATEDRLPCVYAAWNGGGTHEVAIKLAMEMRRVGISVVLEHSVRSFKSSLKRADRLQVRWALLIGEEESRSGFYTLKDLCTGEQSAMDFQELKDLLPKGYMP